MFGQGIVISSESLFKHNQDYRNSINPHHPPIYEPGEVRLCVVPKYKFVLDFSMFSMFNVSIHSIIKHFDLRGTDLESYHDCGMSIEDVEYEMSCDCNCSCDSDCGCDSEEEMCVGSN